MMIRAGRVDVGALIFVLLLILAIGCDGEVAPGGKEQNPTTDFDFRPKTQRAEVAVFDTSFPVFRDVAQQVGISHVFDNGASPRALMTESTGGGVGWIDVDCDGLIDLYLSQGGAQCPESDASLGRDQLFRQSVSGQFKDCFAAAGLDDNGFGHGLAAGDFDNDGFDDLFVANSGRSRLFLNNGDGTFRDGTGLMVGIRDVWSSTAAWADINGDGDLDLYVCNYAIYDACNPVECLDKEGIPSICHPRNVESQPDFCFISNGAGALRENAGELGLSGPGNKALGLVIADLDGEAGAEIYIANDTTANFLFKRGAEGAYTNAAPLLGGAFNATGEPQASMGVGYGDYDGNGFPDLLLTHFSGESNTLYQNRGSQGFVDVSGMTGLRELTLPKLGFGTVMEDFNLDGNMDLFVTNGHIDPRYAEAEGYEMVPQLFSFDGVRWQECGGDENPFLNERRVGRSIGTADYDRDGDLDMCIVHHNSPAQLMQNTTTPANSLQVRLTGTATNRNAINTRVTVISAGRSLTRELVAGTSYAASHERVLTFPLSESTDFLEVIVKWYGEGEESFQVAADARSILIVEGRGDPVEMAE